MKTDLVVLKNQDCVMFDTETFRPNINYRCIKLENKDTVEYLVYGIVFDSETFDRLFETTHEKMMRDFNELGLFQKNGNPISKNKFSNLADIHTYGKGSSKLHILIFRNSRERMYGFYPNQGVKPMQLKESYDYFLEIVNGNMDSVDSGDVCFGNCGIPIYYGKLRIQ
jgi:hypothetical protein